MTKIVDLCKKMGFNNDEVKSVFDPQIFNHAFPENRVVRDLSKDQNDHIAKGDAIVREGVAGILADANTQLLR